jgi:DNA-binding beta-propeller fold protein YncE
MQFVRAINSSADVSPIKSSALADIVFGKETSNQADINKPYGVAIKDGKIYVCDIRNAALIVFDIPRKQTRIVGVTGANRLDHPVAVAVADDDTLYVADNQRGAVVVFDANERYQQLIGFPGFEPAGLAVYGDRLYATDIKGQVVHVFNRVTGEQITSIGGVGDDDGQFRLPLGIATGPDGSVYVMDMMRCRLQKFSPEGEFLAATGQPGDVAGTFARPKHIAVDEDGIIYVVDAAFQNVQMFDDQFRLLMSFGAAGTFPGAMNLPAGIAVSKNLTNMGPDAIHPGFEAKRLVVVANQFGNSKVSVYAMGYLRDGYTAADLAKSSIAVSAGVGVSEEALRLQQQGLFEEPVSEPPAEEGPPNP